MQEYIVKPNDIMYLIAKEFNVPMNQLIRANPQITNPEMIHTGQTIIIPDLLPIPSELEMIETAAVNMIDNIYLGEWASVINSINSVRTAMGRLIPLLRDALVPNNLITGLDTAIRTLEQYVVQNKVFPSISQANQITLYIADILDYYQTIIPTDLRRLAYFARQIIVNVELNNWSEARDNYERIKTVWDRLKAQLSEDYGRDVSNFDALMNQMNDAINRRDYRDTIDAAGMMLSMLSELEADFIQMYT